MAGAPDNEMHQLTLTGGYNFSSTTRLVLTGNYQKMTQNEASPVDPRPSGASPEAEGASSAS